MSCPVSSRTRVRQPEEDWAGVTDPTVRRKLQNKLNQRAQRERRKFHRDQQKAVAQQAKTNHKHAVILPKTSQQGLKYPQPSTLFEAAAMMTHFNEAAYESYYAASPCLDHLLTLSKFNMLRAFIENLNVLGLAIRAVEDDTVSPFNCALGSSPKPHSNCRSTQCLSSSLARLFSFPADSG